MTVRYKKMRTELKEEEKLLIEIKRHWFTLIYPAAIFILSVYLFFSSRYYDYLMNYSYIFVGLMFIAGIYFYYKVSFWGTDIWALTNMRVIDEWGVFSRNTRETSLDKINNVDYRQSLIGLLFGFGDVVVQSAAEEGAMKITFCVKPKELKNLIINAQDEFRQNKGGE